MKLKSLAFATALAATAYAAPAAAEWRGSFSAQPFPASPTNIAACTRALAIQGGVFGTVRAKFPNLAGNGNTTNITLFSDHIAVMYERTGAIPTTATAAPITSRIVTTTVGPALSNVKARYIGIGGLSGNAQFVSVNMVVENINGVAGCTVQIFAPLFKTPTGL
jgi:hypothetical protein